MSNTGPSPSIKGIIQHFSLDNNESRFEDAERKTPTKQQPLRTVSSPLPLRYSPTCSRDGPMPLNPPMNHFGRFSSSGSSYESPTSFDSLDGKIEEPSHSTQQTKNYSYEQNVSIDDLDSVESSVYQTPTSIHETSKLDYLENNKQNLNIYLERISNKIKTEVNAYRRTFTFEKKLNSIIVDNDQIIETKQISDSSKTYCNSYLHEDLSNQQQQQLPNGRRHSVNIILNPVCQRNKTTENCTKSTSDLMRFHTDSTTDSSNLSCSSQTFLNQSKADICRSVKTVTSNESVLSNDDLGPLSFRVSKRSQQRRTSNFLEIPVMEEHFRPRVCSLPNGTYNPRNSDDLYRLRHFSISKGNVVNCGDSIISRRSRSNNSINSNNSRISDYLNVSSNHISVEDDMDSIDSLATTYPVTPQRYRVVMLGSSGVGKTSLVNQFMTSDYIHTYDASLDEEFGEKTVRVLLDDKESELVFIDHPSMEMSAENCLATYEPHGCVVVCSVDDRQSFCEADKILQYLCQEQLNKEKAVILVANKVDLARARVVSNQECKNLAINRSVKFIETSSGIQHNVDELLVGILKQIRLKEHLVQKETTTLNLNRLKTSKTYLSLHLAKEILQKICRSDISKSKSCENLHVL